MDQDCLKTIIGKEAVYLLLKKKYLRFAKGFFRNLALMCITVLFSQSFTPVLCFLTSLNKVCETS